MNPVTQATIMMMIIALPMMFIVIGIFIGLTKVLVAALPPTDEELED
jgi:hypothetical protein